MFWFMNRKVYLNFWNLLAWLYIIVLVNRVLKTDLQNFEEEFKLSGSDMSRHVNSEVCLTYHGAEDVLHCFVGQLKQNPTCASRKCSNGVLIIDSRMFLHGTS